MRLSKYIDQHPAKRKRASSGRSGFDAIAAHGAFMPILVIWGAALFGLSVIVLPETTIARMSVIAGLDRYGFAEAGAALGALLGLLIAAPLRRRALGRLQNVAIVKKATASRVDPIDPSTELGSASLDAPIEAMPFGAARDPEVPADAPQAPTADRQPTLGELAKRGYEMDAPEDHLPDSRADENDLRFNHRHFRAALIEVCEGASCEAAATSPLVEKPQRAAAPTTRPTAPSLPERPRELDLAEFAQLPGRNAVWVEEQPKAAHPVQAASPPRAEQLIPPATALEKLRQTPPEQLSLVEMVERFAAALHEHQSAERRRQPLGGPPRDVALAEALKALSLFTDRGFDRAAPAQATPNEYGETERELREALARLQTLRGAA
jgi:hypothetical protein